MSLINDIVGNGAEYLYTGDTIDTIRDYPNKVMGMANDFGNASKAAGEFKPYTVTAGGASTGFGSGGVTQQLNPQMQAIMDQLQGQAGQQAGMIGNVTPEQLMQQMTALRQPQQQEQDLALENRLAAQGRLGISSNQYGGGTPEQVALARIREQQYSQDAYNSILGARNVQGQDLTNLSSMLDVANMGTQQANSALNTTLTGMQYGSPAQAMLQAKNIANIGQQAVAGVPSMLNSEVILKEAQMQNMLGMLGLAGGGQGGGQGGGNGLTGGGLGGGSGSNNWLSGIIGGGLDWLFNSTDKDLYDTSVGDDNYSGDTKYYDDNGVYDDSGADQGEYYA